VDALDLLFRRLVLAARAAGALERPLEVGELVEKLVPYRAARRDGLLETNDDYLHALMRLLAGERDLVFADELMQDDLAGELKGGNPDLGLIRTYLNVKVRLSTTAVKGVLEGNTEIDLRPPTPIMTPAVKATPVKSTPVASAAIGAPATGSPAPAPSDGCPYCAQPLPAERSVRFCPSCGLDLRLRRCPGCSAEIESGWKYCVTCGRTAA
jgi:hypothetical protein